MKTRSGHLVKKIVTEYHFALSDHISEEESYHSCSDSDYEPKPMYFGDASDSDVSMTDLTLDESTSYVSSSQPSEVTDDRDGDSLCTDSYCHSCYESLSEESKDEPERCRRR